LSTLEHIYIYTDESPEHVAARLSSLLGMDISHDDDGRVYLSRQAHGREGAVGGEVYRNYIADPDATGQDESLIDRFPIVFDVGYTRRNADIQLDEATRLFTELSSMASPPMAMLHGVDSLIAVSTPETGLVWLPEQTTPYPPDRERWLPYVPHGR
jgi:hypothetical protein